MPHQAHGLGHDRVRQAADFLARQSGRIGESGLGQEVAGAKVASPGREVRIRPAHEQIGQRLSLRRRLRPAQMVVVVEQIAEIEHAPFGNNICPDGRADQHGVHHAELHLIDDVGFLAELVVGEELDRELIAGRRLQPGQEEVVPDPRCGELRVVREGSGQSKGRRGRQGRAQHGRSRERGCASREQQPFRYA